jgi:hypothetical protein
MAIPGFGFFGRTTQANNELPDIFPMSMAERDFVRMDVKNIFTRILTDVLERTRGIPDKAETVLWDNCVASESSEGLVTMLAVAMSDKKELFLIYDTGTNLIRKANNAEEQTIRSDYAKANKSSTGIFITFKNFSRSDMVKFYSALEYCTVTGLSKSMRLSTAIQLKITALRSTVSLSDSEKAIVQAKAIAEGLKKGQDVMLDEKDLIECAKPDLTATNSSMEFIIKKQSLYLGMPASYITGESSKGLGDSGKGDTKAVERGLKNYFFSVIKPVVEAMFDANATFNSDDFDKMDTALTTLKTFEVTTDEYLSKENKQLIVNKMFGLDDDEVGDEPETIPLPVAPVVPATQPKVTMQ